MTVEAKLNEVDKSLDQFAAGHSLDVRLIALTELIKRKVLTSVKDDPRLASGLDYLGNLASDKQLDEARLRAIAALSRMGRVKSLGKRARVILQAALEQSLPSLSILKDPDDRYYVGVALNGAKYDWIIPYAAREIVDEKQAEKSRQELVSVLFSGTKTISGSFQLLAKELEGFKPDTKNPGDSVAKRLERILSAIRPQIVSMLIEPGVDAGQCIQDMFRSAFIGAGAPESPEVAQKTAEEIVGLLHDIARTQISLVAEPSIYAALDLPKRWFSPSIWKYIAEKSPNLKMLTRDIREALVLLAKQGVTDIYLLKQLEVSAGSRESAAKIAADIANQNLGLDADVSAWLRSGGKVQTKTSISSMEESQALSADPYLATLLVDCEQFQVSINETLGDAISELRLLEPELAKQLDALVGRSRAVIRDVDALASKRGIKLHGSIGDVVDYSPAMHEMVGGHEQGVRKVKIIQAVVVRESIKGDINVIRKALVEKV